MTDQRGRKLGTTHAPISTDSPRPETHRRDVLRGALGAGAVMATPTVSAVGLVPTFGAATTAVTTTTDPGLTMPLCRELAEGESGVDGFDPDSGCLVFAVSFPDGAIPTTDQVLFFTNDSRWVLGFDTYFSASLGFDLTRIYARAGGDTRANDAQFNTSEFPEASAIIDNAGIIGPRPPRTDRDFVVIDPNECHVLTMCWNATGVDTGRVELFVDGVSMGVELWDVRHNPGGPPTSIIVPPSTPIAVSSRCLYERALLPDERAKAEAAAAATC